MPVVTVTTNVHLCGVLCSNVNSRLSQEVARVTGKPESYVMVLVNGGAQLMFEGEEGRGAFAELVSIGGLTPEVRTELYRAISSVLETELSVPASRCYIKLVDTKVVEPAEKYEVSCLHALHQ